MPRFRFHVYNDDITHDREGKEVPDLAAAVVEAAMSAREIMADELRLNGEITLGHWIEIEDEDGELTVLAFRDAVKIRP